MDASLSTKKERVQLPSVPLVGIAALETPFCPDNACGLGSERHLVSWSEETL